jgi:ketosteroid isomerase-like protein
MRHTLTICFLFVTVFSFAQADSTSLKKAMSDLDKALVNKDEKALMQLLNADVSYGHSNGWVQTKTDIINDLKSGKLSYDRLENINESVVAINGNWATVRTNTNAEAKMNGNTIQIKLHILEVWLKTKTGWQLIARQGVKLQ